jgi:hypothetical protein
LKSACSSDSVATHARCTSLSLPTAGACTRQVYC